MNLTEHINDEQRKRENPEPKEGERPVPRFLIAIVLGLVTWGAVYIVRAPTSRPRPLVADTGSTGSGIDGQAVFTARCQACHQATGQGLPGVFPPLVGSHWVKESPERLLQIVLHGISGDIEVNGAHYAGLMPAFADQLSDEEIAAVTTYIRASWGNDAAAIDMKLVANERTRTADRKSPWNGQKELETLAAAP